MTAFRNYLEAHRNLRVAMLVAGFVAASLALYMGMALRFLVQRADALLILSFAIVALILDFGIAWMLHLHTGGRLCANILFSSVAIVVGAVLTSVAIWRGHWFEMVKEIFAFIVMIR